MSEEKYSFTGEDFDPIMQVKFQLEGDDDTTRAMNSLVPQLYAVNKADALTLYENIGKMGMYMAQMGQLIGQMQQRMDELEARQEKLTVSHRDVLQMMARIRWKAGEICRKYNLQDKDSPRIFRAAMKKDLQKRYQVKDLHDLPAAMLPAAEKQIDSWTDIRLIMERRVST